jgi:hypothetical protein
VLLLLPAGKFSLQRWQVFDAASTQRGKRENVSEIDSTYCEFDWPVVQQLLY